MTAVLGLGTAQFGMDYGISNRSGRTPEAEVARILELAWESGCRILDTASLYGESEEVLGRVLTPKLAFRIVTKTPPLAGNGGAPHLGPSFDTQLEKLRRERVYGLLVHRARDLLGAAGPELYRELCRLKEAGLVERIGVSAYEVEEVEALVAQFDLGLIQIPVNVFDQRLVAGGLMRRLKDHGIEIHARSAFLQGLLLMAPEELPEHLQPLAKPLRNFQAAAVAQGLTPLEAALSYVKNLDGIDAVIVGVINRAELEEVLNAFASPAQFDAAPFACADPRLINPALWPQ